MRCYDCIYWRKGICTEKLGECRVDGPGMTSESLAGRWPVTRSDWGCGRYSGKEEEKFISLNELISTIKEGNK